MSSVRIRRLLLGYDVEQSRPLLLAVREALTVHGRRDAGFRDPCCSRTRSSHSLSHVHLPYQSLGRLSLGGNLSVKLRRC